MHAEVDQELGMPYHKAVASVRSYVIYEASQRAA
jgi:hypothetical protein